MANKDLHTYDPRKHPHRRAWVAAAVALLSLQAALGVRFVQVSVRQEKLHDEWEDDFEDLGIVCTVVASTVTTKGYAYYFAVPGVSNYSFAYSNLTTADEWTGAGYKKSKTIETDADPPVPSRKELGAFSRCWRPAKAKVHKTFDCGDNSDCYKIFDPEDDLKQDLDHWYFFRVIGLLFCGVAVFFAVFLLAFFLFLASGFRGDDGAVGAGVADEAASGAFELKAPPEEAGV